MWSRDLSSAREVLAVRLDDIGDVLMTGPALRAMKTALPSARLTLMASPAGARTAPLLPWVDEVLVERTPWQETNGQRPPDPQGQRQLAERLAERDFDAAFIFTSFTQSPYPPAFACYLAGIGLRAGQSREWGGELLTHLVPAAGDEVSETERNLHLLRALGLGDGDPRLEVRVPATSQARARALLQGSGIAEGEPFIAVAPGASCSARRYPFRRMARACRLLAEGSGLPCVFVDDERGRRQAEDLAACTEGGSVSLAGRMDVPDLAAVIGRASLLLAHNSAPMHLADALGVPMVILYSGTERRHLFAPRSAPSWLLGRVTHCTPCHLFDCPNALECLDLAPELVARSALAMLRRIGDRAPAPRMEVAHA